MSKEEILKLIEKYESWAKVDQLPECMAREYKAIINGLKLLVVVIECQA